MQQSRSSTASDKVDLSAGKASASWTRSTKVDEYGDVNHSDDDNQAEEVVLKRGETADYNHLWEFVQAIKSAANQNPENKKKKCNCNFTTLLASAQRADWPDFEWVALLREAWLRVSCRDISQKEKNRDQLLPAHICYVEKRLKNIKEKKDGGPSKRAKLTAFDYYKQSKKQKFVELPAEEREAKLKRDFDKLDEEMRALFEALC